MSHRTQLRTCIKSVELFVEACRNLGINYLECEKPKVKNYYATGDVDEKGQATHWTAVEAVLTGASKEEIERHGKEWALNQYNVGVKKEDDGTFSLVYDAWGVKDVPEVKDRQWGRRFGQTFGDWKSGSQDGMGGHVGTGSPNKALQEYALCFGESYARTNFMFSERVQHEENGDTTLVLTGGDLLAGEQVHLIARADGTSTMAAIGFSGDRCKQATAPLESALGTIWETELTGDYFHNVDGQHQSQAGGD